MSTKDYERRAEIKRAREEEHKKTIAQFNLFNFKKGVKKMYELNNSYIIEETLYMLTCITDDQFKKIERFCKIGEGRVMKFFDFVQALSDIRSHQISDPDILYPVALQMLMIQDMIDGFGTVDIGVLAD